jgi:hypothetical protein
MLRIVIIILFIGIAAGVVLYPKLIHAPTTSPSVSPTESAQQNEFELKYSLERRLGPIFFCDPDFYPIARNNEQERANEEFVKIQGNPEEFNAIRNHVAITDKLAVYREHKKLNAIILTPEYEGMGASGIRDYKFYLQIEGYAIEGTIDLRGTVKVTKKEQNGNMCPL